MYTVMLYAILLSLSMPLSLLSESLDLNKCASQSNIPRAHLAAIWYLPIQKYRPIAMFAQLAREKEDTLYLSERVHGHKGKRIQISSP